MTLTKTDLVEHVSLQTGLYKGKSAQVVNTLLEIIKETLASGESVMIIGFGKFTVQDKAARPGRNPATGGQVTIAARRVVGFKCSRMLRKKLNGQDPEV